MNNTILYSTPGCTKCKILETILGKKKIEYKKISDIDLMISKGFMSVPVLEINGTTMGFAEAMNYINK